VTPVDLLSLAVVALFGSRLLYIFGRTITPAARQRSWRIMRGLRFRHFAPVPFVLAAVIIAGGLLVQLPVLSFGWWGALGGQGNPAFGITDTTAGTPFEVLIPLVFVVLLLPGLPLLVAREEEIFRLGAEDWSWPKRLWKAVVFGLVHALIGIPIGVAVALSIGGLWFTLAYLRGGLLESTRSHLAYNGFIVSIVLIALVVDAVALLT
jgi:hypothetical protein